ncbi:ATP-binding protein [Gaoshiqia sp. Z1-71]|uniref:ATP-binding protein n=1 Tax=Gaoshiqia hydrogeniformans TaxID=3290090 RepID=UPI003BF829B2
MKRELNIPSSFVYLKEVDLFVRELLRHYHVSDSIAGYINLSICESVNNAILHGNKLDQAKNVKICAELADDFLIVEVEDEGEGFNYHEMPDPTAVENIRNEGGRGLFIIRNLADQLSFKNNGSLVQLKFKLNREHQFLL